MKYRVEVRLSFVSGQSYGTGRRDLIVEAKTEEEARVAGEIEARRQFGDFDAVVVLGPEPPPHTPKQEPS